MTIHHATLKRADKVGVTLIEHEGQTIAYKAGDNSKELASGKDSKKVLAEAEAMLNPKPAAPTKKNGEKRKQPGKKKAKKKAKKRGNSEDGDEESDEGEGSKSVIKAKYKAKYRPNKDTCGDPLVKPVFDYTHPDGEDVDLKRLVKLGKDNGVDALDRWGHLKTKSGAQNVGMIRMNLVNVLRGKLRQGTDVTIGDKTVKGTKKAE